MKEYIWREEGDEYKGRRKNRGELAAQVADGPWEPALLAPGAQQHATISSIASTSSTTG